MAPEDEEAVRRAAEEQSKSDHVPQLPERLKFKGFREALELLFMRAGNAEGIRERTEAAVLFVSTVSDMLDMDEKANVEEKEDAKSFHDFVASYRRPRIRRSIGMSQDGIPVRNMDEPGPEKTHHEFLPTDYRAVTDLLDEVLAEHFIRDVVPWFTAATQIAKKRGYLRAEGETLGFLTEEPEPLAEDMESEEEASDDDVSDVEEGDDFA